MSDCDYCGSDHFIQDYGDWCGECDCYLCPSCQKEDKNGDCICPECKARIESGEQEPRVKRVKK